MIMYLLLSVTLVVCSIGLALGLSSRAEQGVDRRLTSRTSEIESFAKIAYMLLQVVMALQSVGSIKEKSWGFFWAEQAHGTWQACAWLRAL